MDQMIAVEIDAEEDEIVVMLRLEKAELSTRMRPLHAWLALYMLEPEGKYWSEAAPVMFQPMVGVEPVGVQETAEELLLSLPHGHLVVPASQKPALKQSLRDAYYIYNGEEPLGAKYDVLVRHDEQFGGKWPSKN
jgi:hypothetical protein